MNQKTRIKNLTRIEDLRKIELKTNQEVQKPQWKIASL